MNKIIINPKVCDLSPICGGVAVCPTQALQYDKAARKINFDESKCVGCGACVAECPAAALSLARNAEEERQIMAEIDADPRTVEELFVDRYGSTTVDMQPISYAEAIDKTKVVGGGITVLEVWDGENDSCLIMSVPMAEIFAGYNWNHVRIQVTDEVKRGLELSEIPALIFYKDGKRIGAVEGYFSNDPVEQSLLISKVKKILG